MSLVKVCQHWRFLLTAFAVIILVAVAGPLLIFGLFALASSPEGSSFSIIAGLLAAAFPLGWLFFVIWIGDRLDPVEAPEVSVEKHFE